MARTSIRKSDKVFTLAAADEARARIKVAKILNRLDNHVHGDGPPMTSTQITAAKILLDKALPDLAHVTLSGENGQPIQLEITSLDALVL